MPGRQRSERGGNVRSFHVPYANADEANHAPNENLEVERFYLGIKTGAAMLAHLGMTSDE